MSRKILFGIKHLLDGISVRTLTRAVSRLDCSLWINFHRVYPERKVSC